MDAIIPTRLSAYYCENCQAINLSSTLVPNQDVTSYLCPNCSSQNFVPLSKESFTEPGDFSIFPYAQSLLLQKFFELSDNRSQLISFFGQVAPIGLLLPEFEDLSLVLDIDILILLNLKSISTVRFANEEYSQVKGSVTPLIEILENE